ncbi:ABC transporter substrate-binding protein [Candidatus Bipolaricaulota bacterium]
MAIERDRSDLRRLLLFSLGGVVVGIIIASLSALLIINVTDPDRLNGSESTDDLVVVNFQLREDARWSDGTPITADDVVASYNAVLTNRDVGDDLVNEQLFPNDMVLQCEKVDDYVVKFTMSAVTQGGLNALGLDIMRMSQLAEYIRMLETDIPSEALGDTFIPE